MPVAPLLGGAGDLCVPWLVEASLPSPPSRGALPVCTSVSEFPLFIRTPAALHQGFTPLHMTSP